MQRFKAVDGIVLPRREGGSDWDSERLLLARAGLKELWWWKSRKAWLGRGFGTEHAEAELVLATRREQRTPVWRNIHKGGRLSRKLLRAYAVDIDDFFGCVGLAGSLDPWRTLVADEGGELEFEEVERPNRALLLKVCQELEAPLMDLATGESFASDAAIYLPERAPEALERLDLLLARVEGIIPGLREKLKLAGEGS